MLQDKLWVSNYVQSRSALRKTPFRRAGHILQTKETPIFTIIHIITKLPTHMRTGCNK